MLFKVPLIVPSVTVIVPPATIETPEPAKVPEERFKLVMVRLEVGSNVVDALLSVIVPKEPDKFTVEGIVPEP